MLPFNRIIAVVIILLLVVVVGLVTILQSSTDQIQSFSEAHNMCESMGRQSCTSLHIIPSTWGTKLIVTESGNKTCKEIMQCDSCESCGFS